MPSPKLSDAAPGSPPNGAGAGPFLAMLAGNLLLAFGPWFVRLADVGPVAAGFWRLTLAAPLLLLLTRRFDGPMPRLPAKLGWLIALGGLFFAADLAAWHIGIHQTRLANATLFGNLAAFFFAAYGFVIARRFPAPLQGFAILLALGGTMLLLGRSWEMSRETLIGDLLCIAAGLFYTFYLIAMERGRLVLGAWQALTLSTLAGIVPLLIAAWAMGETVWPTHWTPLIALALASQVLGQGLLVWSMGYLSPVIVGLGFLTQPIVAAAVGWLAYGERLEAADMTGAVAIAVALVLVKLKR